MTAARGFARMTPEQRREAAAKGGRRNKGKRGLHLQEAHAAMRQIHLARALLARAEKAIHAAVQGGGK